MRKLRSRGTTAPTSKVAGSRSRRPRERAPARVRGVAAARGAAASAGRPRAAVAGNSNQKTERARRYRRARFDFWIRGPEMAPHTPNAQRPPGNPSAASTIPLLLLLLHGGFRGL